MMAMITREPCRHILNLPSDILLEIADHVNDIADYLHLILTCVSFKTLLISGWRKLSQTMKWYPYAYIAICADRLREALGDEMSDLSLQFYDTIWQCTNPKPIVEFCKRYARATMLHLRQLAKIQEDIIYPLNEILRRQETSKTGINLNYLSFGVRRDWGKLYHREIYVYWAYCDLFRASVHRALPGRPLQINFTHEWYWRKQFLAALVCPPPERWRLDFKVQLDRMIDNKKFEVLIPTKRPVTWQVTGFSERITRILLHGGLVTLKMIAAQAPIVDKDGNVNSAQLPPDVADHVSIVIDRVSSMKQMQLQTDEIYSTTQGWQAPDNYYWFSLESDLNLLDNPCEEHGWDYVESD